MESVIRLAGHMVKFIIKKSLNMKAEDKKKKSGSGSTVVGSLVAGAVVGLAAGILLAPDKGKKTRAKLLKDAEDLKDKLKAKAKDGIDLMTDKE